MVEVVLFMWIVAAFAILCCGVLDLAKMVTSIQWLKREERFPALCDEDQPFIITLLPVLREQRLITDTLHAFTRLKYPQQRHRIFVITAEKELAQREEAKVRLVSLAKDIASKQFSTSFLVEKYLGVFSEDVLKKVLATARHKESDGEIHAFLRQVFDAYPTTIDLVKEDIAFLNKQAGMPLFTHLHCPCVDGNMGQNCSMPSNNYRSTFPTRIWLRVMLTWRSTTQIQDRIQIPLNIWQKHVTPIACNTIPCHQLFSSLRYFLRTGAI